MLKKKRFIFVTSDKGGCGKSLLACLIAEHLHAHGAQPLLVDGDGEVGQLLRFHGARDADGALRRLQPAYEGVLHFALHGSEVEREKIAEILDLGADTVVLDCPAAGLLMLQQASQSFGFIDDIRREGYELIFVTPITPFAASMRAVRNTVALGGVEANYIVVRNEAFADGSDDWIVWDGDTDGQIRPSPGKATLAEVGGIEISLPKLRSAAMSLIDEFRLKFAAAEGDPRLPRYYRAQVRQWRYGVQKMLAPINELLGVVA